MILMFSIDGDLSTDIVASWLKKYNYPYIRVNAAMLVEEEFYFDLNNQCLKIKNMNINIAEIGAIWFRKFFFQGSNQIKRIANTIDFDVANHISKEFATIASGMFSIFHDRKWLTNPGSVHLNKINILRMAKAVGLLIPGTYILNRQKHLQLQNKKMNLISKSVFELKFLHSNKGMFVGYTNRIDDKVVSEIPEDFFPSQLQDEVKKMYEIRVFFLVDTFYSMAIFSQCNAQTDLDFRRYAWDKPNRCVPYTLPKKIESKLNRLLKRINLNCASIDLIRNTDGAYVFVEINPVGQFGMIDFPCNYGLHKKVAETLMIWDQSFLK